MVKIEAIVREEKMEDVKDALNAINVHGMTITQVMGCGLQKGYTKVVRGNTVDINMLPKIKFEIVVSTQEWAQMTIDVIRNAAYTGNHGDGKIFAYELSDCVRIRNWEWKTPGSIWELKYCDFSDSIWEKMTICNANMSNSSFIGASLVEVKFENTSLEGAIFLKCQLPNAVFKFCQELSQSSFEEANLFGAEFHVCTLEKANFYRASASNSIFDNCKLQHSDCSAMYFRNARLDTVDFTAARLYDTTLNWAEIKKCNFTHALADHLQFTFAKCEETDFTYASMSDSCLSGTEFKTCTFLGSDLSESAASDVSFWKSNMTQVDLANVRLVGAVFSDGHFACCDLSGSQFCGGRIIQSQFNSCFFDHAVFSRVYFEDVVFSDCCFDRIFFQQCSFQRVKFIGCTIQSDGSRKEMTLVQLQNCMDPVNKKIVVEDNAYSL